jgi:Pentapeptide repeats (8 copies)
MWRLGRWLLATAIALLVLVVFGLVVPRLLYAPLSAAELQQVPLERRIELQQAQDRTRNDVGATLLQGAAGALLVLGVVATWRQVQVSREGQITERFSRAIDHLGADKPDVRLGGLYTLERIAKDSPADRGTVTAVLGAFVRSHAPWLVGAPNGPEHPSPTVDDKLPWLEHRLPDVQTAMWVLGRRPPSQDEPQLFLSRVDLRAAFLHRARLSDANLRHTTFARSQMVAVDFEGSDLEDADLRLANMRQARLAGAQLYGAHLQQADLRWADLRGAILAGADLRGARLDGANLSDIRYDAKTQWPANFQPPPSLPGPLPRRRPTPPLPTRRPGPPPPQQSV